MYSCVCISILFQTWRRSDSDSFCSNTCQSQKRTKQLHSDKSCYFTKVSTHKRDSITRNKNIFRIVGSRKYRILITFNLFTDLGHLRQPVAQLEVHNLKKIHQQQVCVRFNFLKNVLLIHYINKLYHLFSIYLVFRMNGTFCNYLVIL